MTNTCTPDPKQGKRKRKVKVDYTGFTQPKAQPMRSEAYKAFIRSLPCIICGMPAEHHHEPLNSDSHGTALKGPDNESLPLCCDHHTQDEKARHRMGREEFYEFYGIDWREAVLVYQRRFGKVEYSKVF